MTTSPSSLEVRSSPLWLQLDEYQALFEEFDSIEAPTADQEAAYGAALAAMESAILDKCDAVCSWIEQQEGEVGLLAARAKSLEQRAKAKESAVKRLREHVAYTLNARNIGFIGGRAGDDYKLSVQKNSVPTLTVASQRNLPAQYEMVEFVVRVPMARLAEAEMILRDSLQQGALISVTQAKEMPNVRAIRSALEAGVPVEGCRLERGLHLRIS